MIEPREPAVLRKRRDLEIDRPVALVGVAVLLERPDELRHRIEVLLVGRARPLFDVFEPQRARVFEKRVDPLIRVLAQRHAGLLRSGDRAIVDVREVHDVPDLVVFEVSQRAPQHVDGNERPEVADVAAAVHREPARVHADEVVLRWRERLLPFASACCRAASQSHAIEQILRPRAVGLDLRLQRVDAVELLLVAQPLHEPEAQLRRRTGPCRSRAHGSR